MWRHVWTYLLNLLSQFQPLITQSILVELKKNTVSFFYTYIELIPVQV